MTLVNVRKQGGAAIMTIPVEVARELGLVVGAKLDVVVDGGRLVAKPAELAARKRYSLTELLTGCTPAKMRALVDDTDWAREGEPVGREL